MNPNAFSVSEYNDIADKVGAPQHFRGGVITVHGFNTTGWWQKLLTHVVQEAGLFYTPADYGYVRPGILLPWTQDRAADEIMRAYNVQIAKPNCARPGVIAHSLGSLSLGRGLQTKVALKVSRVIVNGCILPRDFPWEYLAGPQRLQVDKVLNEGGGRDPWPRVARWCVPRAGNAGCYGFNQSPVVINSVNPYGRHSDVHTEAHFRQIWVPFLLYGTVGTAPTVTPPPPPKRKGLSRWIPRWMKGP